MPREVHNYIECYMKFRGYGLKPTTPQIFSISWFQTYQKYVFNGILRPLPDPKMEKLFRQGGGEMKNLNQLPEFEDCNQVLD